ncbi:LCP family protein [Thermosipho atlanticus]|uniref:LCP family protein n=1 Tax=Thermosipho atlanticus TaxID=238991 RepID=UPI001F3B1E7B|nr:LCP family protein [Thermosipho atlanticus]
MVLGLDKDIQGTRRTDVILFVNVDLKNNVIKISNIPRDLIVEGKKINSYYQTEGFERLKSLVEDFTGLKIEKYAIVDYDVIKFIGDSLGPIEIYISEPMKYTDYSQNLFINFEPGLHKLNGKQLLAYLRFRKDFRGDIGRIEREKYIIEKLVQAALKKDLFSLANIYKKVYEMIDTNIKTSELVFLATKFRKSIQIRSVNFPINYTSDGNIYPGDLESYRNSFKEKEEEENNFRFYVLNNTKTQTRTYNVNLYYMWKAAGFIPKDIYDLSKVNFEEDTVYILNDKIDVKIIKDIVRVVHPKRKFVIKYAKDELDKYYLLIDTLTRERNYLEFPVDFIVILTG